MRQSILTPIGYELSARLWLVSSLEIVFAEKSRRVKGESKYFRNDKIGSDVFIVSHLFLVFLLLLLSSVSSYFELENVSWVASCKYPKS